MNLTINQTGGINVLTLRHLHSLQIATAIILLHPLPMGIYQLPVPAAGSGTVDLTASGGNILDFTPSDDSSATLPPQPLAYLVQLSGSSGFGDIDITASILN